MAERKPWIVILPANFKPLKYPALGRIFYPGPNEVTNREHVLTLIKYPAGLKVDRQAAVDLGYVTAAQVKALGFSVKDKDGNEPVVDEETIKHAKSFRPPEDSEPRFARMTVRELAVWAGPDKLNVAFDPRANKDTKVKALKRAWKKKQKEKAEALAAADE